jgi:hypothetical protein
MHGVPMLNEITAPLYDAAGVTPSWAEADGLAIVE